MEVNIEHLIPEHVRQRRVSANRPEILESMGVYLDIPEQPDWARKIARYDYDQARRECNCEWVIESAIPSNLHGVGAGKRCLPFRLVMEISPTAFSSYQVYNNCLAWCFRANMASIAAYDIAARFEPQAWEADPGTAVCYAFRGSRGDTGMTLDRGAWVATNCGVQLRKPYVGGRYDFTRQTEDEDAGYRWGGTGAPKDLLEELAPNKVKQVGEVRDEQAVKDAIFLGGSIMTGSSLTSTDGDPIGGLKGIGGHAQAMIGYDDTDEFRAWYQSVTGKKLTDWVAIFDQSWPEGACAKTKNWPEHLWGAKPAGAFVLKGADAMQLIRQSPKYSADSQGARVFNSVEGFPLRELPDWGSKYYL